MRISTGMRAALSSMFVLALGGMANASDQDCAAIMVKLSGGLAEVGSSHADDPQTCRYDAVTFLPKGASMPYRFGLYINELAITTPDWAAVDEVRIPASVQVTLSGAHTVTQTTRPATNFMINTGAAKFDGSLHYSFDAASQMASVTIDLTGRRLGTLHVENEYRQIDPKAIVQLGPSSLEALQEKRLKIHFDNVGLVEGYLWTFFASSTLQGDDAELHFKTAIAMVNANIAAFAPRFGAETATVDALKSIVSDFPVIQKPIDAEIVLQEPTAIGAIGAALTGAVVPETIKTATFKVHYGS